MPDEQLVWQVLPGPPDTDAGAAGRFQKVCDFEVPRVDGSEYRIETWGAAVGTRFMGAPLERWTPGDGVNHRQPGVGLWDVSSGRLLASVLPPASLPEQIASNPGFAGVSHDGMLLATYRDQHFQIWNLRTGTMLSTFRFGFPSMSYETYEYEGRTCYNVFGSPERPGPGEFSEDGLRFTAWITSWNSWGVWDVTSGRYLRTTDRPAPDARNPWESDCGWVEQDRLLHTGKGTRALFKDGEFVSPGALPFFNADCSYVALRLQPQASMLDFDRDVTPSHIRVFDTATGQLQNWSHVGRVPGYSEQIQFIGTKTDLLLTSSDATAVMARIVDVSTGRETARRKLGNRGFVEPIGAELLLADTDAGTSLWRIDPNW
ncbi:MAG TPA: hypothetical protein VD997_13540 [Phycisphaerales bacterium]|nr:hypothetical protein [Phycisphaerales bacterium]